MPIRFMHIPILLCFISLFAQANIEHSMDYDGGKPYLIVESTPKKDTKLEEGIYKRAEKGGGWIKIVSGNILFNRNTGGIFSRLSGTHRTNGRFEAMSIVNGRPLIYSSNSELNNPDTFLVLGEGENEYWDGQTQRSNELPLIKSLEDITIVPVEAKANTYIISIRDSEKSRAKDQGITILISVQQAASSEARLKLLDKPIVLDHKFYKNNQIIERLSGTKFHSEDLFFKYTSPRKGDSEKVAINKKNVLSSLGLLKPTEALFPFIDLVSYEEKIDEIFVEKVSTYIVMEYNYFNGQNRILSKRKNVSGQFISNDKQLVGSIDFVPGTQDLALFSSANISSSIGQIFFNSGTAYLVGDLFSGPIPLLDYNQIPTSLNFGIYRIDEEKLTVLILVSEEFKDGTKRTWLTDISYISNLEKKVQVSGQIYSISKDFYAGNAIEYRTIMNSEDEILFDTFTPSVTSQRAWEQDRDESSPLLNLNKTFEKGEPRYDFEKPSSIVEISDELLYLKYSDDELPVEYKKSGVYHKENSNNEAIVLGSLVPLPGSKQNYWVKEVFDTSQATEYKFTAFAIDTSYRDSHQVDLYLQLEGRRNLPSPMHLGTYKDMETLRSATLVTSKVKGNSGGAVILVRANQSELEKRVAEVIVIPFKFDRKEYVSISEGESDKAWAKVLSRPQSQFIFKVEDFSHDEIHQRIKMEKQGGLFLAVGSGKSAQSREHRLKELATGSDILASQANNKKLEFGDYEFGKDKIYSFNPWTISRYSAEYNPAFSEIKKKGRSRFKTDFFKKILESLEDLSNTKKAAEHMIVVVPSDLKAFIMNVILSDWLVSKKANFSKSNNSLELNVVSELKTNRQDDILDMYSGFKGQSKQGKRVLLLADFSKLTSIGRPSTETSNNPFRFERMSDTNSDDFEHEDSLLEGETNEAPTSGIDPHLLYLMSVEGERVELGEYRKSALESSISTIVLATPDQLEEFKQHQVESDYGLLDKFKVVQLEAPGVFAQRKLFEKLFDSRPDIRSLGYRFDAKGIVIGDSVAEKKWEDMTETERSYSRDLVLGYFVQRINTLAPSSKMHPIMATTTMIHELSNALLNDRNLRKSGEINIEVIEKVLSSKFMMPLNLNILPEDDPLKVISSPQFFEKMHRQNHDADIGILKQLKKIRLGQTRQDPTMKVPSSVIFFGPSGTGKTSLWLALQRALGNGIYDLSGGKDNTDAKAFIINLEKVVAEDTKDSDIQSNISVKQVLIELDKFIAGPHGARGDILFDDVSKGSPKVLAKILAKIYEILDAENGIYYAHTADGELVDRPVGNLNITLSMNPTEKNSKLDEFKRSRYDELTLEQQIVATLNSEEFPFDLSHLKRISSILVFDKFPEKAKGSSLGRAIKNSATVDFNSQNRLTLITPTFIDEIVKAYPDADARSFMSEGTQATLELSQRDNRQRVKIFAPLKKGIADGLRNQLAAMGGVEKMPMSEFIEKFTQILRVGEGEEANLRLLQLMVDSFRTQIYEALFKKFNLLYEASATDKYIVSMAPQVFMGLSDHIRESSYLPLTSLNLDPSFYGHITAQDIRDFHIRLDEIDESTRNDNFFKAKSMFTMSTSNDYELLFNNKSSEYLRSRSDVMVEISGAFRDLLESTLRSILFVGENESLNPDKWIETVSERMEKTQLNVDNLFTNLMSLYSEFNIGINNESLIENSREGFVGLSEYDKTRLFLYSLDKGLSNLEWHSYLEFMSKLLLKVSSNMVIGSQNEIQNFLFKNRYSLIWPKPHDSLLELIENTQAIEDHNKSRNSNLSWGSAKFSGKCENIFRKIGGK